MNGEGKDWFIKTAKRAPPPVKKQCIADAIRAKQLQGMIDSMKKTIAQLEELVASLGGNS